jgi:hypothetical protein
MKDSEITCYPSKKQGQANQKNQSYPVMVSIMEQSLEHDGEQLDRIRRDTVSVCNSDESRQIMRPGKMKEQATLLSFVVKCTYCHEV